MVLSKFRNRKEIESTFTGYYDDDDQEIHIGHHLYHECMYSVEVIKLSNGEFAAKILDFIKKDISLTLSLNNGIGYTIINKINE